MILNIFAMCMDWGGGGDVAFFFVVILSSDKWNKLMNE